MSEEEVASEAEVLAAVDLDDSADVQDFADENGAEEAEVVDGVIDEGEQEFLAECAPVAEEAPKDGAPSVNQKMLRLQAATPASFPSTYVRRLPLFLFVTAWVRRLRLCVFVTVWSDTQRTPSSRSSRWST